jgi:hypothetical protein
MFRRPAHEQGTITCGDAAPMPPCRSRLISRPTGCGGVAAVGDHQRSTSRAPLTLPGTRSRSSARCALTPANVVRNRVAPAQGCCWELRCVSEFRDEVGDGCADLVSCAGSEEAALVAAHSCGGAVAVQIELDELGARDLGVLTARAGVRRRERAQGAESVAPSCLRTPRRTAIP